jgi:hypothetical protein
VIQKNGVGMISMVKRNQGHQAVDKAMVVTMKMITPGEDLKVSKNLSIDCPCRCRVVLVSQWSDRNATRTIPDAMYLV